ncbi:MAG: hypothetical protein HGA22_06915 [Clostridiales bacterium]|nr:hypothetical protein [Clostridiales bacterium]
MRNLLLTLFSALLLHLLCVAAIIQYQLFPDRKTVTILLFITGALVAGEALALAVGMHLPAGVINPWLSVKNHIFLLFDITIGAVILATAFGRKDVQLSKWLLLFAGVALLLHLYRQWEYISGIANSFCANQQLFILNNVKLLCLLIVFSLTVSFTGEKPYMKISGYHTPVAESVRYSVTASDLSYERLAMDDIVLLLRDYNIGIIIAVRESQLGSELDRLLDIYERNGITVSLAPLLSEEQGLYLNKNTAELYLKLTRKVLEWKDANHHPIAEIVADIEPSFISGMDKYFDFGRFLGNMDKKSFNNSIPDFHEIISEIKSHGCTAVSCVTWFTIEDKALGINAWQDFFGGPSISAGWDSTMIMMYSEWFLESGRIINVNRDTADALIYRYCSDISRLWGDTGGVILGSITGNKGSMYSSGADISKTIAAAKAAGVKQICLYDLKGMLESEDIDVWFQTLKETKSEVPKNRNLQARIYKDVFRWVSRLLNIKEAFS